MQEKKDKKSEKDPTDDLADEASMRNILKPNL